MKRFFTFSFPAAGLQLHGFMTALLCCLLNSSLFAQPDCTSITSGSWTSALTWDCGRVPGNGDEVLVSAGHTVNVSSTISPFLPIMVEVDGTLLFTGVTARMILSAGSGVSLSATGQVTTQTPGTGIHVIEIDGIQYWKGSGGNVTGPVVWGATLPVELLGFEAVPEGGQVRLRWRTATELNNDFFTLERSADGRLFESLKTLPGAGNSHNQRLYSVLDERPLPGIAYYRLKQTDFDGRFSYSPVIAFTFEGGPLLRLYPNPASGRQFTVEMSGLAGELSLELVDLQGRSVLRQRLPADPATTRQLEISVDAGLPAGLYVLQLQNGTHRFSQRVWIP